MAGYNTSSAYDLSEFEDAPKKKPAESPKLKVVKNRKNKPASVLGPGVVCAFAIIVALISLMIYNHVKLNELTNEINELSHELKVLQSDSVKMTSSLESTISLRKVAQLAEELGMQKRDEYQTERIYLYQQDKIERTAAAPKATAAESTKLAVTSFLSRFKEYIGER